jgi:phospholipid/cholesterol/gamma-HCH transport system permease protein
MDNAEARSRRLKRERQASFQLTQRPGEAGVITLQLSGRLTLRNAPTFWKKLTACRPKQKATVRIDLSELKHVDGTGVSLLVSFRRQLEDAGSDADFVGAEGSTKELLKLYERDAKVVRRRRRKPQGLLDQIGAATIRTLVEVQLVMAFFGQMVWGVVLAFRAPRTVNWKDVLPTMERAGADALPIIALINFLVGLVMALQSATQLRRFGADIFIADLIGISVAREIGPLMTAIIICGRTGSAFAAELGTMKTNEEIDALRTMGFGTMRYLVMPRALGLMLVAPLLTIVADLCGFTGGLMVAMYRLDLTASAYIIEAQRAVKWSDVSSGLWKSLGFALATALISCQQGLATTGGAEGVGRRTTAAVVTTLFALILIDVVFTIFFEATR